MGLDLEYINGQTPLVEDELLTFSIKLHFFLRNFFSKTIMQK
jgi:hypothetical protein